MFALLISVSFFFNYCMFQTQFFVPFWRAGICVCLKGGTYPLVSFQTEWAVDQHYVCSHCVIKREGRCSNILLRVTVLLEERLLRVIFVALYMLVLIFLNTFIGFGLNCSKLLIWNFYNANARTGCLWYF